MSLNWDCLWNKQHNTWTLGNIEFIFSCSIWSAVASYLHVWTEKWYLHMWTEKWYLHMLTEKPYLRMWTEQLYLHVWTQKWYLHCFFYIFMWRWRYHVYFIDFNIINRILRRLEVRILSSSLYRPWSWQYRFILAIIRHRVCHLEQYGECTLW